LQKSGILLQVLTTGSDFGTKSAMPNHTRHPIWPYTDVVLRSHLGAGQWYKTINGHMFYFGVLADPAAARKRYLTFLQRNETAAVQPEPPKEGLPLTWLVNGFLTKRSALVEAGERSPGQFARYRAAGELLVNVFGRSTSVQSLTPADFSRLRKEINGGPVHLGNVIRDIRTVFHWGFKHFGASPRYGDEFEKPGKRAVRAASKRRQLWTSTEITAILKNASPALRCFVLLGINCAFGQSDCATFHRGVFDLDSHWMPRGKTLVDRRCPLWPETMAALTCYDRPQPQDPYRHLFFVTRFGLPWVREEVKRDEIGEIKATSYKDSITQELVKTCKAAGVMPRPFYTFRHTFRSVADAVPDVTVINVIMGHSQGGMKEVYTQLMADGMKRLRSVTDHVRDWLGF
jgi:hypothetical protein